MDNMLREGQRGRYCICLGKASWETGTQLSLENWITFEDEEKKSHLDNDTEWLKAQRCEAGPVLKNRVVLSCQGIELVKSSRGLPSEAFEVLMEEGRSPHMKAKAGTLGARDMFSLANMLLKYFSQF